MMGTMVWQVVRHAGSDIHRKNNIVSTLPIYYNIVVTLLPKYT